MKYLFILMVGVALIVFGFITLVPDASWTKQTWIDISVIILLYIFNFSVFSQPWQSIPQFRARIPSIGIVWTSVCFYSLSAIVGLLFAHLARASFFSSMLIQLSLLFVFSVFVLLAFEANRKAMDVQRVESITLGSIDKLRSSFTVGSSAASILNANYPELHRAIENIGSDLRYLSAIPTKNAHGGKDSGRAGTPL